MGYAEDDRPISVSVFIQLILERLYSYDASITNCGSLFHSLIIQTMKKFCRIVVGHLGLYTFSECPLSPRVIFQRIFCSQFVLSLQVS